jgi:Pvc16 N-terminal domain
VAKNIFWDYVFQYMISETLAFLATELNGYLNQKLIPTSDPRVKVGNVARALDGSLTGTFSLEDKAILTLVNIEEDRSVRLQETVIKTATTARYKNPPLQLNVYVLVSIHKDDYADSLILLGHIIQFFQFQNSFTPLTHPNLDSRIQKLMVELYTLNFEQVNHLWSTLGGKYLPSALYKIRQLTLDENAITSESGLIREIRIDERMVRATS